MDDVLGRDLWAVLGELVDARERIMVDDDGVISVLGELDQQVAARHVKRLITQWSNRQRRGQQAAPVEGQLTLAGNDGGEQDEPTAGPADGPSKVAEDGS